MRLLLVFLAVLCLGTKGQAYEKTWLSAERPEDASYLAPKMKFSTLNDSLAYWPGIGVGWILGSVVTVGFEGYLLASHVQLDDAARSPFSMAVAGMVFEAIPSPESRSHLAFNVLMGVGGSQAGGEMELDSLARHGFYVVEPGVNIEFNLTRNIRLCPGASYLWISGNVPGLKSKWDISETAFNLKLKFKKPDNG